MASIAAILANLPHHGTRKVPLFTALLTVVLVVLVLACNKVLPLPD